MASTYVLCPLMTYAECPLISEMEVPGSGVPMSGGQETHGDPEGLRQGGDVSLGVSER